MISGDFCPENRAAELLSNGNQIFSDDYKKIWSSSDFRIANLEGPITNSNSKIEKVGRHIKFNSSIMNGIDKMGVTHFSLANNHILDYGEQGLNDTIANLDNSNINYFGCHSRQVALVEKDNTKVALLSFSNKEFSVMEANNGIGACSMDLINILQTIEEVKNITEHIVVILHTGLSKQPLPSPEQRKLCRFLIDNGVAAVLCQHSHIMGAYEYYKDGFISYGQGSFVFDLNRSNTFWNEGYSIELKVKDNKRNITIIPHKQFDDTLNIRTLTKQEYEGFNRFIEKENSVLKNDLLFKAAWDKYLNEVEKYYFNQFFLPKNRVMKKILNLISFKKLLPKNKKILILNNFRNDEHLEVLKGLMIKD